MTSSSSSTPDLRRLSSTPLSPYEYFTDSTNTINLKSDVILKVGKEKFYCHRLLLSLVSPVFSRMFDGQFREHNEQEITLEGKTSESILELLKYIYPQFNGQITNENIEDFLKLADEYMIDHLKQPCKDVLLKELQLYKYVLLPTQQKLEQPSLKAQSFHASDSALNSSGNDEDNNHNNNSRNHRAPNRPYSSRLRVQDSRHSPTRSTSTYLKPNDKNNSSANTHPRYILYLDKTRMPTFYDPHNVRIIFDNQKVESWLRRLRILYQIDKGRNYGEVIDQLISILQFIPTNLLLPLIHITADTYAIDELMINDIARARMFVLEEWAVDGDPHRAVCLTESYRMMSPNALLIIQQQTSKATDHQENSIESPVITIIDGEDFTATNNSNNNN